MGNTSDAADLAHDTYVRLIASGRTPQPEQSRAYLMQIAKGLVVDLYRRRQIEAAYLDTLASLPEASVPSPEEYALTLETLLRIDAVLGQLLPKVREVFLLSQFDGLTYSMIAEKLNISVGTVRKYMLRAIQACHATFEDQFPAAIHP